MNAGDVVRLRETVIKWFPSTLSRTAIIVKKEQGEKPWHRRFNIMFSNGSCFWVSEDIIEVI